MQKTVHLGLKIFRQTKVQKKLVKPKPFKARFSYRLRLIDSTVNKQNFKYRLQKWARLSVHAYPVFLDRLQDMVSSFMQEIAVIWIPDFVRPRWTMDIYNLGKMSDNGLN